MMSFVVAGLCLFACLPIVLGSTKRCTELGGTCVDSFFCRSNFGGNGHELGGRTNCDDSKLACCFNSKETCEDHHGKYVIQDNCPSTADVIGYPFWTKNSEPTDGFAFKICCALSSGDPGPEPATTKSTRKGSRISDMRTRWRSEKMAKSIMSEPGADSLEEKIAIGFVSERNSNHATNRFPTQAIQDIADDIVEGKVTDNTDGANRWYSPGAMPKEGERTIGFDVKGGLEQTEGLPKKNYAPGWAKTLTRVTIPGVRDDYLKFYKK